MKFHVLDGLLMRFIHFCSLRHTITCMLNIDIFNLSLVLDYIVQDFLQHIKAHSLANSSKINHVSLAAIDIPKQIFPISIFSFAIRQRWLKEKTELMRERKT